MASNDDTGFRPLNELERAILMVLLEGEAHAYAIVTALERQAPGQRIYPANLYRRVNEMVDAGLLEERPVPAEADVRRRRYYRVTPFGRRVARAEAERLARVVEQAKRLGLLRSR
jgi:DNA-binding PadR family transcriptional regulator